MFECFEVSPNNTTESDFLVELVYAQRQKSRAKAMTQSGREVAWFLPRGRVLADGDYLVADSGEVIKVLAANETISEVCSSDTLLLTRAAYHLGNRHVPLQIGQAAVGKTQQDQKQQGERFLRYQHDHVLDDMVQGLGLVVSCEQRPFHPEPGAYHGEGHSHGEHDHHHD